MLRVQSALLERGLLSQSDLARAEDVQARSGGRLPAILVRLGLVAEGDIAGVLAAVTDCPLVSRAELPSLEIPPGLNRRFLVRNAIVPIERTNDALVVAMADPSDDKARSALAFAAGAEVRVRTATFSDIEGILGTDDDLTSDLGEIAGDFGTAAADDVERLLEGESEAPVIRLVQQLMANAVLRRASDIHIEPMARHLMVRYRIDGRLVEAERLPDAFAGPVASRIKVIAGLDIAESRLPQDGRLRLTVRGREVDVRVSTSPTVWGESIVLRLLGRTEVLLDLDRLGLPAPALSRLARALDRPHGIILLTGPTGSGKTTTLYAALNRLKRPEVKILTVEDPVEVLLEGVNQVQVRPEIDLSYAAALRAFLRQDPDILMIGEIRDRETADIALRAALTGHLVLSTLHTNSAAGAFTRLSDIGIEPYLTASTVIAAVAQRLVRALCQSCARMVPVDVDLAHAFHTVGLEKPASVAEANGCSECQHTGYRGRIPLIEILEVDEPVRMDIRAGAIEAIEARRPAAESLAAHGLSLIAAHRTSAVEVRRAVELG